MARRVKKQTVELDNQNTITDEEHMELVRWVNESDDASLPTRTTAEKSRDYYHSRQWTDAEKAKLTAQKQAATVINRIKPKIDGLMGMERANRTTAKAFPRTPQHQQGATAATEAIRFVLDDNQWQQTRSGAWEDLLIEGTTGIDITVKEQGKDFKIVIKQILWDRLLYDPHARKKDFSDAKYLGQVLWMDFDDAVAMFPEGRDVLDSMQHGSHTYDDKPRWIDNARRRVKIVELYYKKDGECKYACFTRGGYMKKPAKSPYVNEEGETEWPYEFGSLFVDKEGFRHGAVMQLLDVQDEINKRRSKALHLMSVRQVMLERGAAEDVNQVRSELSKPDGVVEVTPGMLFEVLKTGDMAAAQFNLLTEAKAEIDAVSYNAAAAGKDTRPMSGVALRNREMSAQTELAPMFDVLKHLDNRVFRKVWNRIRQYWKAEKWIRVTDDPNNVKWVGINATDPATGQQMNVIDELDVDIVISDAPDTVTQEVEDFQALSEMVKSGFPIPPIAVIEASPLAHKDRIIKMMQENPQLPPEHMEQMQKMQEEAQKLAQENQALKMDQSTEVAKIQVKQQADMMELQHKAKMQEMELELERAKAAAQIELERMKAAAQMEMEGMKLQMQTQHEEKKLAMEGETTKKKLDMEQQNSDIENGIKIKEQQMKDQETAMPQFLQALQGMMETMGKIVENQGKMNEEIVKALNRPKTVTLGGIKRNEDGITGASATVQ